jgi:Ca2+/H+ antiporter
MPEPCSQSYAAMRMSPREGHDTARKKIMTRKNLVKNLVLAAPMIALVAMSGQAFAGTAKRHAWTEATAHSNSEALRAFNASHAMMVAPTPTEPDEHRYHGGPKMND